MPQAVEAMEEAEGKLARRKPGRRAAAGAQGAADPAEGREEFEPQIQVPQGGGPAGGGGGAIAAGARRAFEQDLEKSPAASRR
jgi:hypothetical protein